MAPAIYAHHLDPRAYPDYHRRPWPAPTWDVFDGRMQFSAGCQFKIRDNRIIDAAETLDLYVDRFQLGPGLSIGLRCAFADNFDELIEEIRRRQLFLITMWGYVPACHSSADPTFLEAAIPAGLVERLDHELGPRFIALDNGEQDGRYVGHFVHQYCPSHDSKLRQYLNFQRHFQRLGDDLGNRLEALVSLCFGHYFAKEGNHLLLGAETAQCLPSVHVYYAFLRGAGKQYGLHWYAGISVFNRWAFKGYGGKSPVGYYRYGPTEGTSISLMRRLAWTQYLYNAVVMGFESAHFVKPDPGNLPPSEWPAYDPANPQLSPIGKLQRSVIDFVDKHPDPGVMATPAALLLDFFSGWAVPRHIYRSRLFQTWGALPYEPGDYFTHAVLEMAYPRYEDSGYYHDETGFMSATPYGDIIDVLLSDATTAAINQYALVIATGALRADEELRDKLLAFLHHGGHLVVTAGNARWLWPDWISDSCESCPPPTTIRFHDGAEVAETDAFTLHHAHLPAHAVVRATCGALPVVFDVPVGAGLATVLLTPYGVNDHPRVTGPLQADIHDDATYDRPMAAPFALLEHTRRVLDRALGAQRLFSVGDGLGLVTCACEPGKYHLGICNNSWSALPFRIESHLGPIDSIKELPLGPSLRQEIGYLPTGMENHDPGVSDDALIAGGDIRLFQVRLKSENVRRLPALPQPPRPANRCLSIDDDAGIKEAVLSRPTFFHHFDGVKIDYRYLHHRTAAQVAAEHGWLTRQKLRMIVDFSAGLNLYPDLMILADDSELAALQNGKPLQNPAFAVMEDVFAKMELLAARDAVIRLHRRAEGHHDDARTEREFCNGVTILCQLAARYDITLHLQHHSESWRPTFAEIADFAAPIKAANLRLALNAAHMMITGEDAAAGAQTAGDRLGLILLSAARRDCYQQWYDVHAPIHELPPAVTFAWLPAGVLVVLDADYACWDQTYRDLKMLPRC